jgi:hypothetical protein
MGERRSMRAAMPDLCHEYAIALFEAAAVMR